MADISQIKKQLLKDILFLKDKKKGFIRAGLPRFNGLFGRDSLICAWQLLDTEPDIAKNTLKILAELQGRKTDVKTGQEPGKILHEYYPSYTSAQWFKEYKSGYSWLKKEKPVYFSVDSTPLFLFIFSFYFKKTGDEKFLEKHWKNIAAAAEWLKEYGNRDKDFFLEYARQGVAGSFHQGWKDCPDDCLEIKPPVALVEVQGYQYLALKEVSELAEIMGDKILAVRLKERAENLKKEFNEKFWMPAKKFYCLALNGKKEQRKAITSNPGHLLFTGIVADDKIDFVVKRLFRPDLWTRFGIRTHSSEEPDFNYKSYHLGSVWPHDNWIIARGLKKSGYAKEERKIKTAILTAYEEIGFIPEFYGVINDKITLDMEKPVCSPHAWASGALLNFLQ